MRTNPGSQSGVFNPRVLLAFGLCSAGAFLAMLSFAASTPSSKTAAPGPGALVPVVSTSVANSTSTALRDLPPAPPTAERTAERELGPVHPNRPVPLDFVDHALQTSVGVLAMPSPLLTFEGQSADDSGCGCIPPDTNGAVGRTQYVQTVNSVVSVYSKTGTRLAGPTQINALFNALPAGNACRDNNDGDPVVVYDQLADRWLVSEFAVPGGAAGYHECVAISQTPDATGPYYVYDFFLSSTKFEDYPHFGLWPDAYYMSTHEFNTAGTAYLGAGVFAFERAKMLAGQPAQMVSFALGVVNINFGGHLPANLDGFTLPPAGAPNYFAEVDDNAEIPGPGGSDALRIWKFHVDWTTPANSTFGLGGQPNSVTPVTDFTRPSCTQDVSGCVPQPGDEAQLDPIGDRLMYRLAYRNFGDHEALVLNHTVIANATTGQMGPRWYEVRNPGSATPTIFQQSTFGPTGMTDPLYRWMSSIAMDHSGDIAIGYSTSSNVNFPSIAYAGRLLGDPVNMLSQGEAQMFAGGGPQHATLFVPPTGRWGDYTDMTVDPSDDCTFWYTNEYFPGPADFFTVWHTRIGSFKFPQCVPSTPPPGTPVIHPSGSSLITESCFAPNNVIDPGETVSVSLCATNLGSANTTNLVGTLAATGGVTNPSSPQTYGALTAVGAAVCKTFTFTAANQACGSQITASLQLQDGAINLGTINYNFTLGAPIADFSENFDGVTAPALPAGWTATNLVPPAGEPLWVTTTSGPDSPPNAAFASEPSTPTDKRLESPPFLIPATGGTLTFRHKFGFDPGFDGGVLEILIGSGQFTDWLAAGGTFTTNGYNGVIDGSFGNPIVDPVAGTRPAWTNSSNGYITTTATFPASASGQMVQLRFRMGSDALVGGSGWEVDGIAVNQHFICCNAGPVSVVSRKVHGGAGTFDINLPLIGTRGVECRTPGQTGTPGVDYKLVFTFPNNVTSCGSASMGSLSSGPNLNQCTVNLTGLPNAQYTTVTLTGVVESGGATGNVSGRMGLLVGDVNASGVVTSGDTNLCKAQALQTVTNSNFRNDINASGAITTGDVNIIKQNALSQLPTPP